MATAPEIGMMRKRQKTSLGKTDGDANGIGETEAEWPGYPPVNETEQDYDFENDDQSVDMSLVTEDVSTESEQMPRMDSMSNTPDDQIQSEKPAENANPGPRPRIAHVYDDTIAGFFPREDSVEVEQHSAAAAAEPEIDQSERILDSSDDEEVPIPAEFARQVGRADMYDDTIAGFFATAPPISEQNVDGGAGKTSNQTAEAQTPQTKPVAPIPSQNAGRLFTADENDDTIGMFFKGNDKPGKPAVDSSDEDMEVTMDITKCVGRGILKRPKQYDTASTVDSMMSATPTQQSLAHRRRSSLRSASKLSDASPMPSPMNSPVPPKRRTPLKPKRSKPITEIVSSPAPAVNDPPVPTETEEQPFPAPVPTDAEPQMDVGDNEVDADVDEDDTAFDNDMQLEDDLKNANLSMMDESIMEETQSIANVREFLQATAIYFQDNLSTSFRRETNAYLRTDPPEELDFYKAALLWSSELDTYEFGCKELKQYIDDVREDLRHIEAEAEANPPPIFFDVCDGTVQEHNELQRQLKATKSFTRTEAKEDWHIWRSNLLNNLSEYFALNLEHLRKDEKKIQRFAAKFADVQAQVQKANVAKRNQISDTRQRIQDEEKAVRDRLAALDLRQDEQKQQIAQMKVDCEKMRLMCEEEDAKEQALLQEKAALLRSIEGAESVCKDLMVFDPEEMAALRGEYKLLASMFPWTSTQVEADKHVLVYDNIVQVTLEKVAEGAYKVALSIADAKKPLQHLLPTADQETNPVVGAWSRAKIMQVLKVEEEILGVCKGGADMSRITTHVARVWNAVHRLWHEVELARDEFVVEYVDPSPTSTPYPSPSPNDASSTSPPSPPERRLSPLCVATTFFSRPMRTRFTITIGIAATGDASTSTPTVNELLSLGTKWAWNVEVAYGHVDKKHIDRVIEMVPDAPGMLRDAFRQLEGMGTGA
ncbi:Spc7 kinetochore protein-domain-containing protein [Powellomyces hirtus]|nr:Spc7 kinetochore protein-domain-containing protein [Powellomyces hirtus]